MPFPYILTPSQKLGGCPDLTFSLPPPLHPVGTDVGISLRPVLRTKTIGLPYVYCRFKIIGLFRTPQEHENFSEFIISPARIFLNAFKRKKTGKLLVMLANKGYNHIQRALARIERQNAGAESATFSGFVLRRPGRLEAVTAYS